MPKTLQAPSIRIMLATGLALLPACEGSILTARNTPTSLRDAGTALADEGTTLLDAGTVLIDAGAVPIDAGTILVDARTVPDKRAKPDQASLRDGPPKDNRRDTSRDTTSMPSCACSPCHASTSQGYTGQLTAIYLVPTGQSARAEWVSLFRQAMTHVQAWYCKAAGRTFRFSFRVTQTSRTAAKLGCQGDLGACWSGVGAALSEMGLPLWSAKTSFVVAVQTNDGNYGGGRAGNGSGLAIIGADSLRHLVAAGCSPGACGINGNDGDGVTGGLAHEIGHTFGLDHPPANVANRSWSLMAEHWHYPKNGFLSNELTVLAKEAFLAP